MSELKRMQDNLGNLRRSLGFDGGSFAKKLGISRQMVSSLENYHSKLNRIHYLAIHKTASDIINDNKDEFYLANYILDCMIDNPEKIEAAYSDDITQLIKFLTVVVLKTSSERRAAAEAFKLYIKHLESTNSTD